MMTPAFQQLGSSVTRRTKNGLTDASDHLSLHDILRAEPGLDELPVRSLISGSPDPVPHMTAGKDQDGDEGSSLPDRLGLDDGDDVRRGEVETGDPGDDARRDDDVGDGVEWSIDGERVRGQVRQVAVQPFHAKPTSTGGGMKRKSRLAAD